MKKHIINFIFVTLFTKMTISSVKSQTILAGVIGADSTLTLSNSPYLVTSSLIVSPNVTLTVEPGVVVKFNSNVGLLLRGKLVANGTQQDTIQFSSNIVGLGAWAGIRIDNVTGAKVECSYFRGRYADGLFNQVNSFGSDTALKLVNCLLDSNASVIGMDYNNITNTVQYIDSCIFTNNSAVGYVYNTIFKNCNFSNGATGVRNPSGSTPVTYIDNCTFTNFSYVAAGNGLYITNSTFYDNYLAISWSSGTYLHFNNIYNNTIGFQVANVSPNGGEITQNRICSNTVNVNLNYGADFNIMNNCWCSTDSAQIRSTMHDFYQNFNLGAVNFTPFDTTCSFSTAIQNEIITHWDFQIYPNPTNSSITLILPLIKRNAVVRIYNAIGKLESISEVTMTETSLDVSIFESGVYICEVADGVNIFRRKFIKQ